jgi:7,8-dihydropterin-6-yl-methyl-4-(beta-D-ribofuranosyl)aminobenzene 5'-phosphate synthase
VRFTTLYDSFSVSTRLVSGWGFSCRVGDDLLFDTGGNGQSLVGNMMQMGIDPAGVRQVVLSHAHGDHTGGLATLLGVGARPTVYVPRSFALRFKAEVRSYTTLVEVRGPAEIRPGIYSTGEVGRSIVEQALVVETRLGLIIVTGCAHPGVVELVRRAKEIAEGEPYLVMGGFHLGGASRGRIEGIIAELRRLGVRKVAPCHCTGDRAQRMFAEEYGDDFIRNGVGMTIDTESLDRRVE